MSKEFKLFTLAGVALTEPCKCWGTGRHYECEEECKDGSLLTDEGYKLMNFTSSWGSYRLTILEQQIKELTRQVRNISND